ncbi:MAG: HD domain-containing protein [Gemmataceae bacterium]|nr:HD domain-containing protein [Gemmataceae bacterium]
MDDFSAVLDAIAFAARAHRHQMRKDKETPYVSHVFRVCLTVRQVFGIDDPRVLAAAVLHDTIEDTTTDYDDIIEHFGPEVASWVQALTKEKRLPDAQRESEYMQALADAPWQVHVCKLADIHDNLIDSKHLRAEGLARTIRRSREYMAALDARITEPRVRAAYRIVANLLDQREKAV